MDAVRWLSSVSCDFNGSPGNGGTLPCRLQLPALPKRSIHDWGRHEDPLGRRWIHPFSEAIDEVARRPWSNGSAVRVLSAVQAVIPSAVDSAAGAVQWDQIGQAQIQEVERLTQKVAAGLKFDNPEG
jgi:hypothetical protein